MLGVYGKVPAKGDFIGEGLSREIEDTLHSWLLQGVVTSKAEMAEQWLVRYSVAPIWHFYLGAGVMNDSAFIGVLIPSADKVNRHYPLICLKEVAFTLSSPDKLLDYDPWFNRAEEWLLCGLEPGLAFENWLSDMQALSELGSAEGEKPAFASGGSILNDLDSKPGKESLESKENIENRDNMKREVETRSEALLSKRLSVLEKMVFEIAKKLGIETQESTQPERNPGTLNTTPSNPATPAIENAQPLSRVSANTDSELNLTTSKNIFKSLDKLAKANISAHNCIWKCAGSDEVEPQFMLYEGLLESAEFEHLWVGFPASC